MSLEFSHAELKRINKAAAEGNEAAAGEEENYIGHLSQWSWEAECILGLCRFLERAV